MRVVHCKVEPYTHYIGRPSVLGNPYTIGVWTRDQVISAFEAHARATPKVLEAIEALPEDAVLGCWCSPKRCHGDVIVKLWEELRDEHASK